MFTKKEEVSNERRRGNKNLGDLFGPAAYVWRAQPRLEVLAEMDGETAEPSTSASRARTAKTRDLRGRAIAWQHQISRYTLREGGFYGVVALDVPFASGRLSLARASQLRSEIEHTYAADGDGMAGGVLQRISDQCRASQFTLRRSPVEHSRP